MRRLTVVAVGVVAGALLVVALLMALRPFGLELDLSGNGRASGARPWLVSGTCDAAAQTAWNRGPKDGLKLWAVTVGTNMMGYTPVFGRKTKYVLLGTEEGHFPDAFCGGEARHRLLVWGWIVAGTLTVVAAGAIVFRRRSRAAAQHLAG